MKGTYTQFNKQKGPGVLLGLAVLAAAYAYGGIWGTSVLVCAGVLIVGYVIGMLRNPDRPKEQVPMEGHKKTGSGQNWSR